MLDATDALEHLVRPDCVVIDVRPKSDYAKLVRYYMLRMACFSLYFYCRRPELVHCYQSKKIVYSLMYS